VPRKSLRKPTRPKSKYARRRRLRKLRERTRRSQSPRKGRSQGAEALPDALLPRLEFRVPDRGAERLRGDPERAIANEGRRAMTVVDVYDEEAGDASTGTRPCRADQGRGYRLVERALADFANR
jgi:hypothetical protein